MTKRGRTNRAIDQTENELIDQHLFIEAIALCAFEIPYGDPQPSVVAKVNAFIRYNVFRYVIC